MKSTRRMELRTTMPAPAMNPIIDVALKNAPISPWAGRMPTSEKGIAAIKATGWLAALRDPLMASALADLHARPAHPWTAQALAQEARLSRSAFAERFA